MSKRVLVAQFVTESNANIPYKTDLENYDLRFGEDAISQMNMGTVFADAGIEVVPSVYANGFRAVWSPATPLITSRTAC